MQKTKIVPKTKIEMGHRAWNVFEGHCPYKCWYCWATTNKRRFKEPEPLRFNLERYQYRFPKDPERILVCWTIDLMHPSIRSFDIQRIIARTSEAPHCTFIFLTKNPARYAEFDFPKNCWLGVTVTSRKDQIKISDLPWTKKVNLFFVSIEPMLGEIDTGVLWCLNWVIDGAMTGTKARQYRPAKHWIEPIVEFTRKKKTPLFLKNNLRPIWGDKLIQEFPQT